MLLNANDGPTTFVQLWAERVAVGEGEVERSAPMPAITGIESVTGVADLVLKAALPALWPAPGVGAIMQMG
ncbi:MAG: hypothetical protein HY329_26130 [Chloroflexi bacterium]|nr:hypothetical protein [Chloroflexota bacterium]